MLEMLITHPHEDTEQTTGNQIWSSQELWAEDKHFGTISLQMTEAKMWEQRGTLGTPAFFDSKTEEGEELANERRTDLCDTGKKIRSMWEKNS